MPGDGVRGMQARAGREVRAWAPVTPGHERTARAAGRGRGPVAVVDMGSEGLHDGRGGSVAVWGRARAGGGKTRRHAGRRRGGCGGEGGGEGRAPGRKGRMGRRREGPRPEPVQPSDAAGRRDAVSESAVGSKRLSRPPPPAAAPAAAGAAKRVGRRFGSAAGHGDTYPAFNSESSGCRRNREPSESLNCQPE